MMFSVKNTVRDVPPFQHAAEYFRLVYGYSTNKNRLSALVAFFYLINHGIIFFTAGFINDVILIVSDTRLVGGNNNNIQFINLMKFVCFRFGRAGHTGEPGIQAEIVLDGNTRIGL